MRRYGCSPPSSSVHGILWARILEWVAIPPSGDLPDPGIEPGSPAWQADSLLSEPPGKPTHNHTPIHIQPCTYTQSTVGKEKTQSHPVLMTWTTNEHWEKGAEVCSCQLGSALSTHSLAPATHGREAEG